MREGKIKRVKRIQHLCAFGTNQKIYCYDITPLRKPSRLSKRHDSVAASDQTESNSNSVHNSPGPRLLYRLDHGASVVAFSSDGLTLFTGQGTGDVGEYTTGICIWDAQSGALLGQLGSETKRTHQRRTVIHQISYLKTYGTNTLISAQSESAGYSIRLWDILKRECVAAFAITQFAKQHVSLSRFGTSILSVEQYSYNMLNHNRLQIWDISPHVSFLEKNRGGDERVDDDDWMKNLSVLSRILRRHFIRDVCPIIFAYAQVSFTCERCKKKGCTHELDSLYDAMMRMQECRYHPGVCEEKVYYHAHRRDTYYTNKLQSWTCCGAPPSFGGCRPGPHVRPRAQMHIRGHSNKPSLVITRS